MAGDTSTAAPGLERGVERITISDRRGTGFSTVPFDIYDLVAAYLLPHELLALCLVSRRFLEVFEPILRRSLRFRWPAEGKRKRCDWEFLLATNFEEHLVSLELDLAMRSKANCSLPINMNKHGRRKFLGKLKARGSTILSCLVLQQHGAKPGQSDRMLQHFPEWAGNFLAGVQNLRRLTLAGSAFQHAPAIAELLMASRGLQVLEIYSRPHTRYGVRSKGEVSSRILVEGSRNFWAQLLSIVTWKLTSDTGEGGTHRPGQPLLQLHTLAVDEYAVADFSSLTDLSVLRRLRLLNRTPADVFASPKSHWTFKFEFDPAANCFYGATRLSSLEATTLTTDVLHLATHLQSSNPGALLELLTDTGNPDLAPHALALPLRRLRLMPCDLSTHFSGQLLKGIRSPTTLEHIAITCSDHGKEEALLEFLNRFLHLKTVFLYVDLLPAHPNYSRVPKTPPPKWAASIFRSHEIAVRFAARFTATARARAGISSPTRSRLSEITFVVRMGLHYQLRVRKQVFFKSWDDRVPDALPPPVAGATAAASGAGETETKKEEGEEKDNEKEKGEVREGSSGGWRLACFSHIVPRDEDNRY